MHRNNWLWLVGYFFIFVMSSFGADPPPVSKLNPAGKVIYEQLMLGRKNPDVFVWKVADTLEILHYGGGNFPMHRTNGTPVFAMQIMHRGLGDCASLNELLPNPWEVIDSFATYNVPLSLISVLDTMDCVGSIAPVGSPFMAPFTGNGLMLQYGEDWAVNALRFSLITVHEFPSSGYCLNFSTYFSGTNDSAVVRHSVGNTRAQIVTWGFESAGGSFSIPLEMTNYKLLVVGDADTAVFDVHVTTDSISVVPINASRVLPITGPHRRLPRDVFYIGFTRWEDGRLDEFREFLLKEMRNSHAKMIKIKTGSYGSFYVSDDPLGRACIKKYQYTRQGYGSGPVFFFKCREDSSVIKESWREVVKRGRELGVYPWLALFPGQMRWAE